jgi:hypothetical protein
LDASSGASLNIERDDEEAGEVDQRPAKPGEWQIVAAMQRRAEAYSAMPYNFRPSNALARFPDSLRISNE